MSCLESWRATLFFPSLRPFPFWWQMKDVRAGSDPNGASKIGFCHQRRSGLLNYWTIQQNAAGSSDHHLRDHESWVVLLWKGSSAPTPKKAWAGGFVGCFSKSKPFPLFPQNFSLLWLEFHWINRLLWEDSAPFQCWRTSDSRFIQGF